MTSDAVDLLLTCWSGVRRCALRPNFEYPSPCGRRRYAPQINNLGGAGPETDASSRVMRFESVGLRDGVPFDMLITNSTPVHYGRDTCLAGCDDKNDGAFVELPVQVNREYSVSIRFVDPNNGDSDVTLPAFILSIFDLDSSPAHSIGNRERVKVRADTGSFTFTAGDEIDVVGDNPKDGIAFQNAFSFSGPVPNPNNGLVLTAAQLAVSVTTIVALVLVPCHCALVPVSTGPASRLPAIRSILSIALRAVLQRHALGLCRSQCSFRTSPSCP